MAIVECPSTCWMTRMSTHFPIFYGVYRIISCGKGEIPIDKHGTSRIPSDQSYMTRQGSKAMVTEVQSPFQLAQRRLAVRRYWRKVGDRDKSREATTHGIAEALQTSATAVNEFENGHREDLANGKTRADYIRLIDRLEAEKERHERRAK